MKLVYRGIAYERDPIAVDLVESPVLGQYRGQSFHFSYPRHIPVPQPALDLKYRGVAYHRDSQGVTTPIAPTARPEAAVRPVYTSGGAMISQSRKAKLAEAAKVHHETISRHLQHRLEVARQKGDQSLIQQLEHEMQQIA